VIVGAGFGGYFTARRLIRELTAEEATITVVTDTDGLVYQPLLPEVAVGALDPRTIVVPLATTLAAATVVRKRVKGIDIDAQTLSVNDPTGSKQLINYDRLVLAPGGVTRMRDIPGLAEHALGPLPTTLTSPTAPKPTCYGYCAPSRSRSTIPSSPRQGETAMKVLATGATGQFAGLVVPALVERGIEVRAVVHDPDKADVARRHGAVETVPADLSDRASLDAALDGVDGAFLITPAFHPQASELGVNFVEAAIAAGVSKLVYNGVYHPSLGLVNHASTRPTEAAVYASELDFTVLQPAMYMQGLEGTYQQARTSGALVVPWSKQSKMTYVDYRDVAEAAAIAFTDPRLSYATFELAAGGMINRVELAQLMSRAAGTTITAQDMPTPPEVPDGLAAMFGDYDQHGFHGGNPLVLRTILQRDPRSITDYITELAGRKP
jgi:uncharacterized protein YbjT (DUF2867 family)